MRIVTDYKHAQQIIVELDVRIAELQARVDELEAENKELDDLNYIQAGRIAEVENNEH